MGPLRDLLAVDQRKTLEFFFVGLKDVSEAGVDQRELLYNASVLAHYAQVSTQSDTEFPTPAALGTVFDHFVGTSDAPIDTEMLETAGSHCLLMAGFFEDSDEAAAQRAVVRVTGSQLLLPGGRARAVTDARVVPRHDGTALRAVAPAPCEAEPGTARHAVPAESGDAAAHDVAACHDSRRVAVRAAPQTGNALASNPSGTRPVGAISA